MSYILDALRRAEAQRARGAVPGLHGQPPAGVQGLRASATPGPSWLAVAVVVLSLLLVTTIGLAWWWPGRTAVPPGHVTSTTPGAVAMAPATVTEGLQGQAPGAPAAAPAPARTPPGSAVAPPPANPSLQRPQAAAPGVPGRPDASPSRPAVTPPPEVSGREPPARPPAVRAPATVPPVAEGPRAPRAGTADPAVPSTPATDGRKPAVTAPKGPPSGVEPAAPTALPRRSELPPELQRELPALALGGTVFSSDPGQRMVVLNGEVWREGDRPVAGVTVSEVRRKDVVLSYKGQSFVLGP